MRVAFLNPTFPPRAVPLLNRIAAAKNVTLHAIIFSESQKNRRWNLDSKEYGQINFDYTILNSTSLGFGIGDYHNTFVSFNIFTALNKCDPDMVVLPGWSDINSLFALIWAKKNGKKIILRSESTSREASWRRSLFLPYTKLILKKVDYLIGSSNAAVDYARQLNPAISASCIYSSTDTSSLAKNVSKARKKKTAIKKRLKLSQKHIVYFNGQLIQRKGLPQLLTAFSGNALSQIGLVITGHGPLEAQVKAAAKQKNIHFLGYQTQDKLPDIYASADVFILPSFEETWGLVVIEAMASSLPIITSQFVGASELITSEKNGLIIDQITPTAISKAIQHIFTLNLSSIKKANQNMALKQLNYDSIANQFTQVFQKLHS